MTRPALSLAGRLVLGSVLLLPLFLGASSWYLERSHRQSLEAAQAQRLQLQVLTLLAQAEYHGRLSMPEKLLEGRYNQPNSGLYAQVTDASGASLWLSPSAVALPPALTGRPLPRLRPGERRFGRRDGLYALSWQVLWETDEGAEVPLLFTVMESAGPVEADIALYRHGLLLWLGGAALLLLACQGVILAWALRPLRRLAGEIAAIESGDADRLGGVYPREIQPLTDNLNTLLQGERRRQERVRNTLSDLAHSLKTPLAVLRSADPTAADYAAQVSAQTDRMEQIVHYQLQRASGGSHRLLQLIPLAPLLQRLRETLLKVYADKPLHIELALAPDCQFRGDERDLLEVVGNVLENACKYGRNRVMISVEGGAPGPLTLSIADDGEGIPADQRQGILQRGARLDQLDQGQGLGLAVAADIVDSYRGRVEITDSVLGGARVVIHFP